MGEAKIRRLRERESAVKVLEQWAFEPSSEEEATVSAIRSLPVVEVERAQPDEIAHMRMKERLCHDNCAWHEENDPSGEWKAITGWLVDRSTGNYVLHAVIRSSSGQYRCITPTPHVSIRKFEFIPDRAIVTTREEDGGYRHVRDGHVLGPGVRSDPTETVSRIRVARERILAGDELFEIMRGLSDP